MLHLREYLLYKITHSQRNTFFTVMLNCFIRYKKSYYGVGMVSIRTMCLCDDQYTSDSLFIIVKRTVHCVLHCIVLGLCI